MTDPDEGRVEGRIRSSSDGVQVPVEGIERVVSSGRRRRTNGRFLASGIGVAVALAIVLPLRSLSHLGDSVTSASSSNHGYLAFTKEVEGKREIWLVRPDGSDLHPLPTDLAIVAEPSWSPDGTRLVFTGGVEKNTEPSHLYVMSADGSDVEQLTDKTGEVWDMDPAWSPDGSLIAFSRAENGQGAIAILDTASESVTMLTGGEFNQANTPTWSPDGARIAFTANLRGKYGIFVMNADGSEVHPITELDGSIGAESPAWSPDGTKLAFVRGGALYTMGTDGTGESLIPTGPDVLVADGPGWSPDGSRIAFMGTVCPSGTSPFPIPGGEDVIDCNGHASIEVFTATPQGADLDQVTTGSGETAGYSPSGIENPSWQPKGPSQEPAATDTDAVPVVITLMGTEAEPTATVNFGDLWQAGVFEKYTWCSTPDDCATVETDLAYPPIQDGVEVPVGAPIRFAGDAQVERAVIRTTAGDQASPNVIADTDGTAISVPDVPGDYLIWVAADWDQGSGALYLRIRATALDTSAPNVVAITCTTDGTEVPATAMVTPRGPRFTIDNQSGAAQVLIAGVSGEARQYAANIDLSQRTTSTFDIPPGDYVVGCFQDEVQGPGGAQAWQDLPGMVPTTILDPGGTYASSMLTCEGQHADSSFGLAEVPTGSTPEDAIRAATDGIEDSDVIETAGYPGNQGQQGLGHQMFQLRLVREGATLAAFSVTSVAEGDPFVVDVIACEGTGIEARKPSGPSPTPVGG